MAFFLQNISRLGIIHLIFSHFHVIQNPSISALAAIWMEAKQLEHNRKRKSFKGLFL
jgi:hypothetical protein